MRRLSLLLALLACHAQAKTLTDLGGRAVRVPETVERVACLEVLCYPTLFLLGVADRAQFMIQTNAPWMLATNAQAAQITKLGTEADMEALAARNIDLAFFSYNVARMQPQLDAIGLPGLVSQQTGKPPHTEDDYVRTAKATIMLFGEAFGGEALERARDYCAWFDEKRAFVAARVAGLTLEQRRRLFYVRGPRTQNTHGKYAYVYWLGMLAGAHVVVGDAPLAANGPMNMEDILEPGPGSREQYE